MAVGSVQWGWGVVGSGADTGDVGSAVGAWGRGFAVGWATVPLVFVSAGGVLSAF